MDFSLTQVYVLNNSNAFAGGNAVPAAISTPGLVQFVGPDYKTTVSLAAPYFYVMQGKLANAPAILPNTKSDRIYPSKIVDFYKVAANKTAALQITKLSNPVFECDQDINVTLRLFSNYINTAFFNGLTRTVTVKTPCCECGDNPCATVSATTVLSAIVDKINAEPMLKKYVTAQLDEGGESISIFAKLLDVYGNECVPPAFPYEYDRLYFRTYIYAGPETTQDYIVYDRCDIPGTLTVDQRATFPSGSPAQVKQMVKNFWSYNTLFKHLFFNPLYNYSFETNVDDSKFYDMYVLKFKSPDLNTWAGTVPEDETVILFAPAATGSVSSDLETTLETITGLSLADYSQAALTTTVTTAWSTPTTASTPTTLMP